MNAEERETLSLGLARGNSLKTMAAVLKRAPSTVSRELARNVTRGQALSGLHGTHIGDRSRLSAAATT
jgi:IS30 family transposase